MRIRNNLSAAFIALSVGVAGWPIVATPVQAQGLLERFFRGGEFARRERQADLQRQREAAAAAQAQAVKPVARISGPRYYTYRADKLVEIDFARIADPVVTGSTMTSGFPSLGLNPFNEGRAALAGLKISALEEVASAVVEHYSTHPDYLWVEGTGATENARAVIDVFEDAASVGLDPRDYRVSLPSDAFDVSRGAARQQQLMRFEMSLSVAVASYTLDAVRGRVDPNRISGYHDFKRKTPDLSAALEKIAHSDDAAATLESYNPQGTHFAALVDELARLKTADDKKEIALPADLLLRPGESSLELANVVEAIRAKASDELKAEHALVLASYAGKPEYDPGIVALVEDFQEESGLSADGVVGPNTVRALVGVSNAAKMEKVRLAMERARWLPGVLANRYVFINQPAFTATYVDNGEPELVTRVVVGKRSNQTYFFSDVIETVEFNPYWGVPQSIIINEMLPKLRRDPSYLDRLGYEVFSNGREVSSSAINWNTIGRNNAIGVRQPPSPGNALGQLKILFPNSHAIYMHDTPSKSLFKRDTRAFSHGCVRLQDPRAMAAKVLGVSMDDVAAQIAGGQNKGVNVPEEIPVHVAYFTAWPNGEGKVEYFADIYRRDSYLQKAIDATVAARGQQS